MRVAAPMNATTETYSLFSQGSLRKRWYAAYTYPRHEKRIAEHLSGRSMAHFLPLSKHVSRWKDRQKIVQRPLFPGYIFVRLDLEDRSQVLKIPGIVYLVSFRGLPEPLPEGEIDALRTGLEQARQVREYPYARVGQRMHISCGPLAGLTGVVRRIKGKCHVILSVDLIQRSLIVEVEASSLEYSAPPTL